MIHKLKLERKYYLDSKNGSKSFEVRINDRNYKVGDLILLCEIGDNKNFTGASHIKEIRYVLDSSELVKEKYVILGVANRNDYYYMMNMEFLTTLSETELNELFISDNDFRHPKFKMSRDFI